MIVEVEERFGFVVKSKEFDCLKLVRWLKCPKKMEKIVEVIEKAF